MREKFYANTFDDFDDSLDKFAADLWNIRKVCEKSNYYNNLVLRNTYFYYLIIFKKIVIKKYAIPFKLFV